MLKVWIPFVDSSCKNQGLVNVQTSILGTVTYEDGKLGKAARFGDGTSAAQANGISINSNLVEELGNEYSCAVWVKPMGNHLHYEGAIISSGNWNHDRWAFGVSQDNTKVDLFGPGYNRHVICEVPVDEWTHLVSTVKNKIGTLYKNGTLVGTYDFSIFPDGLQSDANNTTIGRETYAGGYFSFNGCLQDIRVYNHCLSTLEIHKLSQGLIGHYPLNREGFGADNLLKNTNDLTMWNKESGVQVEWDSNLQMYKVYTTTRESSRWGIYQNINVEVQEDTKYTLSVDVKTEEFVGGVNYNAWTSGWPFTKSISKNTEKYKEIITQNIPSGTTIIRVYLCMYPLTGGGYIYFSRPKLEVGTTATPWTPNPTDSLYTVMGLDSGIVYDVSGYQNNGELYTTDGTGEFIWESDTPKYNVSCHVHSLNSTTSSKAGTAYICANCGLVEPEQLTIAFWCYARAEGYNGETHQGVFCTTNNTGDATGSDYLVSAMNQYDSGARFSFTSGNGIRLGNIIIPNEWHHYTFTFDGITASQYRDGVLISSSSYSSNQNLGSFTSVILGFSRAGGVWRRNNNNYSDLRVYATCLSAADVAVLYNASISL